MVQHLWDEHSGQEQEVILRVLSRHIKALDRQVQESVLIEKVSEIGKECLNLKSQWAGSKVPSHRVSSPQGMFSNNQEGEMEDEKEVRKPAQFSRRQSGEEVKDFHIGCLTRRKVLALG